LDKINIHRVLIAPLDWGLGHATRCIPIIRAFRDLQIEVVIAAEGSVAILLGEEFPEVRIIPILGYQIQYAKTSAGLFWKLLLQVPKIINTIRKEHIWLEQIIQEEKIDLVISDNRYGLYTNQVPCIFITHQLTIKIPNELIEKLLQKINYHYINRFTTCWVPDSEDVRNIAGILSHPKKMPRIPVKYLGILTRMMNKKNPIVNYHYCFLLSGPEPQRTLLENQILKILPQLSGIIILVRGLPGNLSSVEVSEKIKVFNHLSSDGLEAIISSSNLIICRSGYTTIMDLIGLEKKALLIPTPKQTEQEYLGEKLQLDGFFFTSKQKDLNLLEAIVQADNFPAKFSNISKFSTNVLEALLLEI